MSTGDRPTLLGMVLAHQGGWDEVLLILVPIALFAGLLWLANHRAERTLAQRKAALDDADRNEE
ncbi:hypothetical protein HC251_24730 (plasmid) [Iamia sp. SCSIO 61187]|uniref:hypothetical protein n=1 Tax=Iamia sp. SCSIO 61187 TaxID=2722752 RepID=UPI001C62B6CB|nr:hypothetical protein [Iamia sp. SCSIO 61187]QYG94346.1 hypothetical protein HC251_19190 [Iamia sp. SCSIO 61187]QYG95761.1 hypothetical protein HC251_24730 [Iamia sp. SCSIO 61187]